MVLAGSTADGVLGKLPRRIDGIYRSLFEFGRGGAEWIGGST
jgi:hypothetical protein